MMNKLLVVIICCASRVCLAETNETERLPDLILSRLDTVKMEIGKEQVEFLNHQSMSFDDLICRMPVYQAFAPLVTNNWQTVVTNINQITTNFVDRALILGTGKLGDEELFLRYYETLAQMKIRNEISAKDYLWFHAARRFDLNTVILRRYREPAVSNLIEILKVAAPDTNYWNYVQSGEAYREYQAEADCGMWGPNPPR